jgi:hypothetical protein
MIQKRSLAALTIGTACTFTCAAQNFFTGELLTNPGAETGNLAGWTTLSGSQFTSPSVDGGTYDPGLNPHTGSWQFVGDHIPGGGTQGYLAQTVDVSAFASSIDGNAGHALLSFWEQSYDQGGPSGSDYAHISLTFKASDGTTLGMVTSPNFASTAGWVNYSHSYPVPAGARFITYTMAFFRQNNGGTYIDSFIDDNSLKLAVPEPESAGIAAGAALAAAAATRRIRSKAA